MKQIKILTIGFILVFISIQGCKKYNKIEPLSFNEIKPKKGSPEYYEALREYKKSDHAIAFGWWGGSNPPGLTSDMSTRYMGLPDSMDIVSLWDGIPEDSSVMAELQYVREVKGTRFVMVLFGSRVDDLRQKNFPDLDLMESIDSVAKSIADTVDKYNIDGFDLDYEPNFGDVSIFGDEGSNGYVTDDPHTERLFKALSKYLGPESGTDKILMIDGQFDINIEPYIDYLAQQAYSTSTASSLQSRFENYGGGVLPSKKFIVTENMQQYGGFGNDFIYKGENIGSVLGMAHWNPDQGRKGGFGGYIIGKDVLSNPSKGYYYHIRKGIQIQNPAVH